MINSLAFGTKSLSFCLENLHRYIESRKINLSRWKTEKDEKDVVIDNCLPSNASKIHHHQPQTSSVWLNTKFGLAVVAPLH